MVEETATDADLSSGLHVGLVGQVKSTRMNDCINL